MRFIAKDHCCTQRVTGCCIMTMHQPTHLILFNNFWPIIKFHKSTSLHIHLILLPATSSSSLNSNFALKGRRFDDVDDIKKNATEQLRRVEQKDFQNCFQQWQERWTKCIVSEGDYFEGD